MKRERQRGKLGRMPRTGYSAQGIGEKACEGNEKIKLNDSEGRMRVRRAKCHR